MEKQVENMIPHLKKGSSYLFEHVRKGPFVGVFQGSHPTKDSDLQDTIWLEVDIITEDGSGQERLANALIRDEQGNKTHPPISQKLIRPSLLRSISSPSTAAQQQMLEQFTRIRAEAAAKGEAESLPTLSLPTEKAMAHLEGAPKPRRRLWPFGREN